MVACYQLLEKNANLISVAIYKMLFYHKLVIRMGRRRGEVQILMDILNTSLNGVKVTRLMYKTNLSYSTLRKYLSATLKQGLIGRVHDSDGSVVYHTTEKGQLLLNKLEEVKLALRV